MKLWLKNNDDNVNAHMLTVSPIGDNVNGDNDDNVNAHMLTVPPIGEGVQDQDQVFVSSVAPTQ